MIGEDYFYTAMMPPRLMEAMLCIGCRSSLGYAEWEELALGDLIDDLLYTNLALREHGSCVSIYTYMHLEGRSEAIHWRQH